MLSNEENKYVEKWTSTQISLQFQRRMIMSMTGLVGILGLVLLFAVQQTPLVVEKKEELIFPLSVQRKEIVPTKEAISDLVSEFVRVRYEWNEFNPEKIVKSLEPLTTEGLRSKLLQEFGQKSHKNKEGDSVEQSVSRIKPEVSEQSILATFDRVLRVNNIPIVVPTEISIQLVEGPQTTVNPMGLYVNGMMEHENK